MIIQDKILEDPEKNQHLVGLLHEIDRRLNEIKIIDSNPPSPPERVLFAYNRTDKTLVISDTDSLRKVATEEI